MLLNSREQLIIDHMNAIAKFFGDWRDTSINNEVILERWNILQNIEKMAHEAAEVLCDGEPRGKGYYKDNKNANCEIAENRILTYEKQLKNYLRGWLKDPHQDIARLLFVNEDPRGYAFKIRLSQDDRFTSGIYYDWGYNGILCPDIELRKWKDDQGEQMERYMFN